MNKKIWISIGLLIVLIILAVFLFMSKRSNNEIIINNDNVKLVNGKFNLNLIKTVNSNKNENYLISPYSIEIALNLLRAGASGETLTEIENVVGNREINDVSINNRVSVANAAFIKNKYKDYIKDDFYNTIVEKYNSELLYDDFKTPKVINDWVNDKTDGMIEKILSSVDPSFAIGLANALAIDVEWDGPFDCIETKSQQFIKMDGSKYNVEMMHKTLKNSNYKYLKSNLATGVIIPYKMYNAKNGEVDYEKGNGLEFIGILPNGDVNSYINNLTNHELNELDSSAREVNNDFQIKLSLPRFKYEYTLDNFKDVLMALGIKQAFDDTYADFTNIMEKRDNVGNLYVGEAIHKTYIDLNEKGTKAAAVTYFGMYTSGMIMEEPEYVTLTFDKPFIYMIRDTKTKEMLFFGVVYEPNKWVGSTCKVDD